MAANSAGRFAAVLAGAQTIVEARHVGVLIARLVHENRVLLVHVATDILLPTKNKLLKTTEVQMDMPGDGLSFWIISDEIRTAAVCLHTIPCSAYLQGMRWSVQPVGEYKAASCGPFLGSFAILMELMVRAREKWPASMAGRRHVGVQNQRGHTFGV